MYTDSAALRADAERIAAAFAGEVARAPGESLAHAPRVQVRNTPALISFSPTANTIVLRGGTRPPPDCARRSGPSPAEATLYGNENASNRLAVAFWRTQPGGEPFLTELERLATTRPPTSTTPRRPAKTPLTYTPDGSSGR